MPGGGALLPGCEGEELGELGGILLGVLGLLGLLGGGGGGVLWEEQAVMNATPAARARRRSGPAIFLRAATLGFSEFDMFDSSACDSSTGPRAIPSRLPRAREPFAPATE